jgi:hypothetical protein
MGAFPAAQDRTIRFYLPNTFHFFPIKMKKTGAKDLFYKFTPAN